MEQQAELEHLKKQNELLMKQQETEFQIKQQQMMINQKKWEADQTIDYYEKKGDSGLLIYTAESPKQIHDHVEKNLEDRKDLQRKIIEAYLKTADLSDPENITDLLDSIKRYRAI